MPGFFPGRPGGEHDEPLLDMILERRPIPPGAPPEIHGLARMLAAVAGPAEAGDLPGEAAALAAFARPGSPAGTSPAALRSARRPLSERPARGRLPLAVALAAAAAGLGSTAAAYAGVLPSPIQHFAHVAIGAPDPTRNFALHPPAAAISPAHRHRDGGPSAPVKQPSAAFSGPVSAKTHPRQPHGHGQNGYGVVGLPSCLPPGQLQNHGRTVGHSKDPVVPSPTPNPTKPGSDHGSGGSSGSGPGQNTASPAFSLPGSLASLTQTACQPGSTATKAAHAGGQLGRRLRRPEPGCPVRLASGRDIRLTARRARPMLADVTGTADHVLRNRAVWDEWASSYAGPGVRHWSAAEPTWGIWGIPEAQAGVLPSGLDGAGSIELGCGTGYVSAWLARRGARPVALDNSPGQLKTARELQERFGVRFPLLHANAERAPFADASFDLAISEYGASIWCDPYAWIPEAARLLRPGGQLIFLVNSVLMMLTIPDEDGLPATGQLLRPYFGMHRFEWPDDDSVEFHLGHGDMIRLLRRCGLEVEDLLELRPGPAATASHPLATIEWARQWPCEEVWKARKA